MKTIRWSGLLCLVSILGIIQAGAAAADKERDNKKNSVEAVLAATPAPEVPARAADLVLTAKQKDRDEVALAAIAYVANYRPASIAPVVGSLSKALPESAAAVAAAAAKLVPNEAQAIRQAALDAAPGYAQQINNALTTPEEVKNPVVISNPGNRPSEPPGQSGIRGNRPAVPPGHVRDPKPGRDPQRRRYGAP